MSRKWISMLLLFTLSCSAMAAGTKPKLIIVLFGGGTRYSESIGDPKHRFVPHLWNDMVPQGTLFTDMRVEGKVVHPNSAGSIVTGHWEWDDLDWTRPVAHPTLYEIYRKECNAGDLTAWSFVYASILAQSGESRAKGYGKPYAANIVEPPTIPRATAEEMDRRMRAAAESGSTAAEIAATRDCEKLVRETSVIATSGLRSPEARAFLDAKFTAWKGATGTTSHDAFLTDCAVDCMKQFAPDIITVMYGEIDCAHYGSWSRYTEAITRTDALTWRLWQVVQALPAYKDQTLMLILPDHGRELERKDGMGFIHHSDFYTDQGSDEGCRKVWMLALGPGVPTDKRIDTRFPITTVAATGLEYLGLHAAKGAARSVWRKIK